MVKKKATQPLADRNVLSFSLPEILIVLFYLITHFFRLLEFPVFADEAIYIRWAQLILDDPLRYAFFPLNDGKTPLFIWLLAPLQIILSGLANQLWASRFLAVGVGLIQLYITKMLIKSLGGRQKTQWAGMVLVTILPFWFFYHRIALMDGLLTVFVSLTFYGLIRLHQTVKIQSSTVRRNQIAWIIFTGLNFGLAIWTKIPALFLLPSFPFVLFLTPRFNHKTLWRWVWSISGAAVLGLVLFATLRISPAFGQLFRRSSDFTYSIPEVLSGHWRDTLPSLPTYVGYFIAYLTWPILLLSIAGLFSNRFRRTTAVCLMFAGVFGAPFWILGKVIYARYFLPAAIFFTVSAVLNLQAFYDRYFTQQTRLTTKTLSALLLASLIAITISSAALFMTDQYVAVDQTPFVSSDRTQYLETWSAGQGIAETVAYIRQQAQHHTIAVATEGRFGTLPDGLLLYFHGLDVNHIYIEGTGQYPVKSLPNFFTQRAKNFAQSILVVNSDRMDIPLPQANLITQYCRPNSAPCLQIWDVTELVQNPNK